MFEFSFGEGTRTLANAVAISAALPPSPAAAMPWRRSDKYGARQADLYISTGGGAFLEFVEGKVLPAVEIS